MPIIGSRETHDYREFTPESRGNLFTHQKLGGKIVILKTACAALPRAWHAGSVRGLLLMCERAVENTPHHLASAVHSTATPPVSSPLGASVPPLFPLFSRPWPPMHPVPRRVAAADANGGSTRASSAGPGVGGGGGAGPSKEGHLTSTCRSPGTRISNPLALAPAPLL